MRWLIAALAAAWGVGLLTLAVPRTIASLAAAPAFPVVIAMHRGEVTTDGQLDAATDILRQALPWSDGGRLRSDLGYVMLLRAARAEDQDVAPAADMLAESLARAPARPHTWVRLAYARTLAGEQDPVAPLLRSIDAGTYVPTLTVPRLELLLRHWDALPTVARRLTAEQVRYAWVLSRREVVALARRTGQGHIIRFALAGIPQAQAQLDAALAPR